MTWFRIDDSFHSHPKAAAASLAALGLWSVAGSWAGQHLTDGFVPEHMVPLLARGASELADELVTAGLWKRAKGGYRFHDWTDRNPRREQVEADRTAASERMRKLRAGRKGAGRKPNRSGEQAPNNPGTSDELQNPDPNFFQKFRGRPPASPGGADDPDNQTPDYRELPAFGEPREPADAERARRGAAQARANIRLPPRTNGHRGAFVELLAVTDPPRPSPHPFDDDGTGSCLRCSQPYTNEAHAVGETS